MLQYVRLSADAPLPVEVPLRPYKAVVVLDSLVSPERQKLISRWLVDTGCLYMMAWGPGCSSWDDSVDRANLEDFDFKDVPEDSFVMTTWHERDPLDDVFRFAKNNAFHPTMDLDHTVIVHLGEEDKGAQFTDAFNNA